MRDFATDSPQAMARVLALVLIADTELGPEELLALDELSVCDRIGIPRKEFMDISRDYGAQLAQRMGPKDSLRLSDPTLVDELLAGVSNYGLRLLVARLAAGLIVADGRVSGTERRLYLHMLSRWGLSERLVTEAIRAERRPFAEALAEP
jgi:hypothetical protein